MAERVGDHHALPAAVPRVRQPVGAGRWNRPPRGGGAAGVFAGADFADFGASYAGQCPGSARLWPIGRWKFIVFEPGGAVFLLIRCGAGGFDLGARPDLCAALFGDFALYPIPGASIPLGKRAIGGPP